MTETDTGIDRPRGILSESDRKYLSAPEEYTRQAASVRRAHIEKRIRNAILDVPVLIKHADEPAVQRALDTSISRDNLAESVSFLHTRHHTEYGLAQALGEGIERSLRAEGECVMVDVSVDITPVPPGAPAAHRTTSSVDGDDT